MTEADELAGARWRHLPGARGAAGIEVALLADGRTAVRRADDPGGVVLFFTPAEMDAFIKGVKAGEFDDLIE